MLNELHDWESIMEAIIGSIQQDFPVSSSIPSSSIPRTQLIPSSTSQQKQIESFERLRRERKNKGKRNNFHL